MNAPAEFRLIDEIDPAVPVSVHGIDAIVSEWVAAQLGMEPSAFAPSAAIGVVHDGGLIAGAVYHQYRPQKHGATVEASLASTSPRWCTRAVLKAMFAYPFVQLGATRLQVTCARKNRRARRLAERLGFRMEGVGRRLWDGKQDAIVYSMMPEECRWLGRGVMRKAA